VPGTRQPVWHDAAEALQVIMQLVTPEVTVEDAGGAVDGILGGSTCAKTPALAAALIAAARKTTTNLSLRMTPGPRFLSQAGP